MNYSKSVGCFNVSINDGNLNHEDNRWYYGLQVDRFSKETDEWKDNNFFYIKGHKDGDVKEKSVITDAVLEWYKNLTEADVEILYKNKRNYQFEVEVYQPKVVIPMKARLI